MKKAEKIFETTCDVILFLFFAAVLINAVLLFARPEPETIGGILNERNDEHRYRQFDWSETYPFPEGTNNAFGAGNAPIVSGRLQQIVSRVAHLKPFDVSDSLAERAKQFSAKIETKIYPRFFAGIVATYESLALWNYLPYYSSGPSASVRTKDGFLTNIVHYGDFAKNAEKMKTFAEYCRSQGVEIMYVNAPSKVCKFEDPDLYGAIDYSNANAEKFIALLDEYGVPNCDLLQSIHEDGISHHERYYRTDLHWRVETALWVAKKISESLDKDGRFQIDLSLFDQDRFTRELYPDLFLGIQGRKLTIARAKPESFTLLYPQYPTDLRFEAPNRGVDEEGDFSIVYDLWNVENKGDFYERYPYSAVAYGSHELSRIENRRASNDHKILLVHDSYGDSVFPFLALGVREIIAVDPRYFSGSIRSLIEKERPDVVVTLYASCELISSATFFDFR